MMARRILNCIYLLVNLLVEPNLFARLQSCHLLSFATCFRIMFYVDHHDLKHLITNIILSIFSNDFILKCETKN